MPEDQRISAGLMPASGHLWSPAHGPIAALPLFPRKPTKFALLRRSLAGFRVQTLQFLHVHLVRCDTVARTIGLPCGVARAASCQALAVSSRIFSVANPFSTTNRSSVFSQWL